LFIHVTCNVTEWYFFGNGQDMQVSVSKNQIYSHVWELSESIFIRAAEIND